MTTELEDRLRAGMERVTEQVRVPPDLARRALRHRRRRRAAVYAVAATGTAAAVAGTAVAIPAMTGSTGAPRVGATAYVVSRIRGAVTGTGAGDVARTSTVLSSSRHPVTSFTWGYGVSTDPASRWPVTRVDGWSYGSQSAITGYTADGHAVVREQRTATAITQVIYPPKVWWRAHPRGSGRGPASGCVMAPDMFAVGNGAGWPGLIRSMLGCGGFKVTGRERVGPVLAIKVSDVAPDGSGETLWVDPATYLPVRVTIVMLPGYAERTAIQWLPATPGNLAHLGAAIPAGFRQAAAPGWTRASG